MKDKRSILLAVALNVILLFLASFVFAKSSLAATCTTTGDGNWTDNGIWDCGHVPNPGDDAIIYHSVSVTSATSVHNLTVTSSGSLTGDLWADDDLFVSGNWTIDGFGTFTPGTSTVTFLGSSGDQTIGGSNFVDFYNLVIDNNSSTGWVVVSKQIEIKDSGSVTITNGAKVDAGTDFITFDGAGTLTNNGKLKITKPVAGITGFPVTVKFPADGTGDYKGVDITTENDLGNVEVLIQGNAATCTTESAPNYVQRCFSITPTATSNLTSTVKLHADSAELNGILPGALTVYHWAPGWAALTDDHANGTDALGFSWAQGTVDDFSPFLLGKETPNAIDLAAFSARDDRSGVFPWITALFLVGLIGASGFFWHRHRRR